MLKKVQCLEFGNNAVSTGYIETNSIVSIMDTEYIGSLSMYVTEVATTKRSFRVIGKSSELAAYFRDTELEVRCAYCGMVYEEGTPESRREQLSSHIEKCELHPLRAFEKRVAELEEEVARSKRT